MDNIAVFNNGADFGADVSISGSATILSNLTVDSDLTLNGALTGSATLDLPTKTYNLAIAGNTTFTNVSTPSLFDLWNGNLTLAPAINAAYIRFGFAGQGFFNNFRCDIFNAGTNGTTSNTRVVEVQVTPPNDGGANFTCRAYGYDGTSLVYYYASQTVGTTWTPGFDIKAGGRATLIMDYTARQIILQGNGIQ